MKTEVSTGPRKVEYRLTCSCGLNTAWRVERKRIPMHCWASSRERDKHVATLEKRVSARGVERVFQLIGDLWA